MRDRYLIFSFGCTLQFSLLVFLCFFVSPIGDSLAAMHARPQSNDELLVGAKEKRFATYGIDFATFAKSMPAPSFEYDITEGFLADASETTEELHAAGSLLEIYDGLSCEQDREKSRVVIERDIHYYVQFIEQHITTANLGIAHTQNPGVAAEGIRMRDDMREAKTILDSIKLR
jgi:hypothetical protein